MYIKNPVFSLIYRCLILAVCSAGLILNLFIRQSRFDSESLIYYTNLSNLICVLYYVPLAARTVMRLRDKASGSVTLFPRIKGALILMVAVTILVYHFFLAGAAQGGISVQRWLANMLLHYAAPMMVILDWILFDPKRIFRRFDPLFWLILPLLYVLFTLIRAEIGGEITGKGSRFPYFFLDIDAIGWSGMLGFTGIFALVFIVLGYIVLLLDRYTFRKPS